MTKCAIMQPAYLPWSGYFNLISQVDIFVFLDDVQFEKGGWQNRNRVLLNGQPHFLTVPIRHTSLQQHIREVEIDDTRNWRKKHYSTIRQTYSKSQYARDIELILSIILDTSLKRLVDLNTKIICEVADFLSLSPKFIFSSELEILGKRTERLVKMCDCLGCDEYISPVGAKVYLMEDGHFESSKTRLTFQNFIPKPYPQSGGSNFVSHLSIIDIVANIGWVGTKTYITQHKAYL